MQYSTQKILVLKDSLGIFNASLSRILNEQSLLWIFDRNQSFWSRMNGLDALKLNVKLNVDLIILSKYLDASVCYEVVS